MHKASNSTQLANGGGPTSHIPDFSYFGKSECRHRYGRDIVRRIEQYTICGGDGKLPKDPSCEIEKSD